VSWKKFLIDMMYLDGYVSLLPSTPTSPTRPCSFNTNHMEPGAHISALKHDKTDFEVPRWHPASDDLLQEEDI
jgi:hypothetical protein